MVTLLSPRLRSCADRPATGTARSFSRSSGVRAVAGAAGAGAAAGAAASAGDGARPAASGEPHASERCRSSTAGSEPSAASKAASPCTTVVTRRPELGPPGTSTSTSTTSPGEATDEPAGVPVRMMSPVSSVKCCERSATSWGRENSRPDVVSSCAIAPFSQVRTRSAPGSTSRASMSDGPIGVKPSPPLDRTLEPLSPARRSYRPKSSAAVTQATCRHASASGTLRAGSPMTSAISPSNASSSVPAGRSMVPPDAATELDGLKKYEGCCGRRPR